MAPRKGQKGQPICDPIRSYKKRIQKGKFLIMYSNREQDDVEIKLEIAKKSQSPYFKACLTKRWIVLDSTTEEHLAGETIKCYTKFLEDPDELKNFIQEQEMTYQQEGQRFYLFAHLIKDDAFKTFIQENFEMMQAHETAIKQIYQHRLNLLYNEGKGRPSIPERTPHETKYINELLKMELDFIEEKAKNIAKVEKRIPEEVAEEIDGLFKTVLHFENDLKEATWYLINQKVNLGRERLGEDPTFLKDLWIKKILDKLTRKQTKVYHIDIGNFERVEVNCPNHADGETAFYVCQRCLKNLSSKQSLAKHKKQCNVSIGKKIYEINGLQIGDYNEFVVLQVDGKLDAEYCECLWKLGRLFIEPKDVYVSDFRNEEMKYYIIMARGGKKYDFAAYFSKSNWGLSLEYNLSTLMTMPYFQGHGLARFLIELSYALGKREYGPCKRVHHVMTGGQKLAKQIGKPQQPFTAGSEKAYHSYWNDLVLKFACSKFDKFTRNGKERYLPIETISKETGIHEDNLMDLNDEKELFRQVGKGLVLDLKTFNKTDAMKTLSSKTRIPIDQKQIDQWEVPLRRWSPSFYNEVKEYEMWEKLFDMPTYDQAAQFVQSLKLIPVPDSKFVDADDPNNYLELYQCSLDVENCKVRMMLSRNQVLNWKEIQHNHPNDGSKPPRCQESIYPNIKTKKAKK